MIVKEKKKRFDETRGNVCTGALCNSTVSICSYNIIKILRLAEAETGPDIGMNIYIYIHILARGR